MSNPPSSLDAKGASQQADGPPKPPHFESYTKEPYSKRLKRYCNRNLGRVLIGIELFCALALVVITGKYTYYAGGQLREMRKATKASQKSAEAAKSAADTASTQTQFMLQQLNLQREIARLEKGGAKVRVKGIAFYHEEDKVRHAIQVENDGNREATKISICTKIEFSVPIVIPNQCVPFQTANPNYLQTFNEKAQKLELAVVYSPITSLPPQYSVNETSTFYIRGAIHYTDYTGADLLDLFCKEISAKKALNARSGLNNTTGALFGEPKNCTD
jgi:hypothetical protein